MEETNTFPITPYLTVRNAKKAVEFYIRAFGAEEIERYEDSDGRRLGHVTLRINRGLLYLSDEFPEIPSVGTRSPTELSGTTCTIVLHVDDPDIWWKRATAVGLEILRPLANDFYGRTGKLRDPFGHTWSIIGPQTDEAA